MFLLMGRGMPWLLAEPRDAGTVAARALVAYGVLLAGSASWRHVS
jgi:hypothetical protein